MVLLTLFTAGSAVVQADPSTEVLLGNNSSTKDPVSAGLQSGRYQSKETTADDQPVFRPRKKKMITKKPASEGAPIPAPALTKVEPPAEPTPSAPPTLGDQVKDLFTGGEGHVGDLYREQVHQDDIRNNKVEIDIGTGVVYNNSTANLAYRNYYSFAPYLKAGAHVWLTPLVGVSGSYLSTFSETIPSALTAGNMINAKSAWTQLSLDFRKFYGMSRRANSINYGLLYSQYTFTVPSTEVSRIGLTSSGLGVYLNARIPTAPSYSWVFGGSLIPVLSHAENQTSLALQSGNSNTASRLGLSLGGEIKMSRENQLIWSVEVQMEKDQFSGNSSLPDPYTGLTPTGVSVVNTWTYFNLGYRWGQ